MTKVSKQDGLPEELGGHVLPQQPGEYHFSIAARAATALGALVDGNGLSAQQVRLVRHETTVHQLPGLIAVTLKPDIRKSEFKGQAAQGEVMGSHQAVVGKVESMVTEILKSRDVLEGFLKSVDQDAGRGWGLKDAKMPLDGSKKTYSYIEKCMKCSGTAAFGCTDCAATGRIQCQDCFGQGGMTCQICLGTGQFQKSDGTRATCLKCHGNGRITCGKCSGNRLVPCLLCAGSGRVGCGECGMTGYWTYVYDASYVATLHFEPDREKVPPEVLELVDEIGLRELATGRHAEIFRLAPETHQKDDTVPLVALFPVAWAEISVDGKARPALVAGLQGRVMEIDAFLDPHVKAGINALIKLSKGGVAAEALLQTACKHRLVREALDDAARHSRKAVYLGLLKKYPLVLSDKYARATAKYARDALLSLGRGPRMKGMLAGVLGAGLLSAGYYFSPLRGLAAGLMTQSMLPPVIADAAVWVFGFILAIVSIKATAAREVAKILPGGKAPWQPAGDEGLYAFFTTLLIWMAAGFFAPVRPEWWEMIVTKVSAFMPAVSP